MQPTRPSDDEVTAHLQDCHGITVSRLSTPESHNPFVLRVHRRAESPDWIARLFNPKRPRQRAEEEAEILRYLERHGYPAERCASPQPVSELGERTVLVTEYAGEGAQEHPAVADRLHGEDALVRLGDLLGRLHTLPIEPGAVSRPGGAWHGDPRFEGAPHRDVEAAVAMLDEVAGRVPVHARSRFDELQSRLAVLDGWGADLPSALIHPDFMWKNIVVAATDELIPIDWTGAGQGPRVFNLVGLSSFAISGTAVDGQKLAAVARGYRQHVALTDEEARAVADARRVTQLRFAVLSYYESAKFGYFGNGTEGWWPADDVNIQLAAAFAEVFSNEGERR